MDQELIPSTAPVEIERSRATQEVQASLVIAKKFPRDEIASENRILTSCQRYSLAEGAMYSYPRAKQKVTGPSIRLAEVLARHWGNCNYGFRELESEQGRSTVQSYCWDLETNTRAERTFVVEHYVQKRDRTRKKLTDPRDVYEHIASQAQRRVRACILEIIPSDIVEKAVEKCRETIKKGEGNEPLIDRVKKMVQAFSVLGVTQEMIEQRLDHRLEAVTLDELVDLREIYNSIKDRISKREDWFTFKGVTDEKTEELNEMVSGDDKKNKKN